MRSVDVSIMQYDNNHITLYSPKMLKTIYFIMKQIIFNIQCVCKLYKQFGQSLTKCNIL